MKTSFDIDVSYFLVYNIILDSLIKCDSLLRCLFEKIIDMCKPTRDSGESQKEHVAGDIPPADVQFSKKGRLWTQVSVHASLLL